MFLVVLYASRRTRDVYQKEPSSFPAGSHCRQTSAATLPQTYSYLTFNHCLLLFLAMAAVGGRRNFIEGVAPRSLPAASISRDIGCVRCVKRLEKDPGHKCVKRAGMRNCNNCRGLKSKCVPVSNFNRVVVAYAIQVPHFFLEHGSRTSD